ncbi:MAG: bifunctional ADP-heptose synthase [Methylacidiphilales bacterium]|nr:bifunctional ADP-heptose synthase [Candidatus Methylacidiphilales bacterium]MDW8349013.1 bifunctional ADP-heptose synthase [Verrucomicrobiae bacterium]
MKVCADRLKALVRQFPSLRVVVIGDVMLDEFVWGKVRRISPEAPVPVLEVKEEEMFPGGAANVARNLRSLGAQVVLLGRIGKDHHGAILKQLLHDQQIETYFLETETIPTIVKTRIIAREDSLHVGSSLLPRDNRSRVIIRPQHIVRVDREDRTPITSLEWGALVPTLDRLLSDADALIVEDYGKGFVTQEVADAVADCCAHHQVLWTVDPNPTNPLFWRGPKAIKPNRSEAFAAADRRLSDRDEDLDHVGQRLLSMWQTELLLITLGDQGMALYDRQGSKYRSATKAKEVYDVSGAGDTVIAAFTLALAASATPIEATEIANHAAGIVVEKLGTATVSPEELIAGLMNA